MARMAFLIKVLISSVVIASASEIAKRSTFMAAILVSLPITSLVAIVWLYLETRDPQKIIELSFGIFWAVLPSLIFFIVLPLLLKSGLRFGWAMIISSLVMAAGYAVYVALLNRFGIRI